MKMEVGVLEEDVLILVEQEASQIVDILCEEKDNVLQQIYDLVETRTREKIQSLPTLRDCVSGLVDYFINSDRRRCCHFLNTLWMFCDSLPLDLDIKILSVAGSVTENNTQPPDIENSPPSPAVKRACLDHVCIYTDTVKNFLLKKFERVTKDMRKKVCLRETWLCWKQQKSVRVRDRSAKVQEEYSLQEHKESVESLLKNTGKVIVLSGQAGSGKTLLMHCLGRVWAQGAYPSIQLLFLLEFRQLNLITQPLSLKELLFRYFLPPEEDDEQSEAVLSYILDNPEKICFIFDGYDEFGAKLTHPEKLVDSISPDQRLPMVDLLSGLCNCKVLPRCTVLVTCRPRDVFDLFGNSDCSVAELLGFSQERVKEYTEDYFHEKGNKLKEKAVSLLMGSHHLLSMSHVPGLCHVCCLCLEHLLLNDGSQKPETRLPTSLTQIYLHILAAFLNRCHVLKGSGNAVPLLKKYRSEIAKLSRLAVDGLEKSCIVFSAHELTPALMNFGANAGILSRVDLTCADGSRSLGCAFTHLTMQEFMAALHLMTSPDVTESQLKLKLNLKSRWTAKSDPKTVFTDSLHLFLYGLAAEACTSSLVLLEGSGDAKAKVLKRQEAVRRTLQSFVVSYRQTGPKIIELCRCAHETQDVSLARAVGSRERFELRNIRLNPVDMDALAFVTSSSNQMVCLDFGACSIEAECLNIIPNCKNLEYLIFRSRKYDNKFAEALAAILPDVQTLQKLDFVGGSLTDTGATKLFQALRQCTQITHLSLCDNSLKDESIKKIPDLLLNLENLTTVMLGKNNFSRNGIFMLIEKMASFPNFKKFYVSGKLELNVHLSPISHTPNGGTDELNHADIPREVVLHDCVLKVTQMNRLCSTLKSYPSLHHLNISKNFLGNKGLKRLLDQLPKLISIQEINLSDNGVNMDGMVQLATSLHTHANLQEIEASQSGGEKLFLRFYSKRDSVNTVISDLCDSHPHKKFCLTQSDMKSADITRLCKNFSKCKNPLKLDFQNGIFNDESVEKLLSFLPDLKSVQLLNLSNVEMSTNGAVLLVQSLSKCKRTTAVELRPQGKAFIKFQNNKPDAVTCRLNQYRLNRACMVKLCKILQHCSHLTDLDLSGNFIQDDGVKIFTEFLPKLQIGRSVSLGDNGLTEEGALHLVNSINSCDRVSSVEVSVREETQCLIHFMQENMTGRTLSLRHCSFEFGHLQQFIEILSRCSTQLHLQLSSISVPDQSLHSLLNNLASLNLIEAVKMRNNALNAEAITHLIGQLCADNGHRSFRIEEPWIRAEAAVNLVADCLKLNPHIRELRLEKNGVDLFFGNVTTSGRTDSLSAVHCISLSDCDVEGQHLSLLQSAVQNCFLLQELHFSQLKMGTSGAEFLSSVLPSLTHLKILSLSSKAETGDEAVIFSLQNAQTHLESLCLSHHVIGDGAAAALGNALVAWTNIHSLNLLQCSGWTEAGGLDLVRGLVCCCSLEELRLESVVLNEESVACLSQGFKALTSLKKISLLKMTVYKSNGVLRLLAGLHSLRELEELELVGLRLDDEAIEELVKCIPTWSSLRIINLSENFVSDHAGKRLVIALSNCHELQQLNLSRNKLGPEATTTLGQVLQSLSQITEINLSENKLGSSGCLGLCEALIGMKALRKLHLTSVGTSELVAVVAAFIHCTSLEDVSLSWNECGNDVVLKLVEVLPQCRKLRKIDLEANNITTAGARTLAVCLRSCPWIEIIRLWRNKIVKDDQILKDQRLNFSST